jgi:hypothetical protein
MLVLTLLGVVVVPTLTATAAGAAIESLGGCSDSSLPATDDGSSSEVPLPFTLGFFGQSFTSVFVNNNGNVTFGGPLSAFTPFDLTSTNSVIIAPFFADVDTTAGAVTTFGVTTFGGRTALCAMWNGVGYFSSHTDKTNRFQLLLVDRNDRGAGDFDIVFNYDQIQWETGDASGGSGGLGGSSARAGFSNGSGAPHTFFEIDGSAVNGAFLDGGPSSLSAGSLRSATPGRYIFPVIGGAPPSGGSISGGVFIDGTGRVGAPVAACPAGGGGPCINTQTGSGGQYLLEPVPPGTYDVTAYPPAGETATPFIIPVGIADGQAIEALNFELSDVKLGPESFDVGPADERSGFPRTFWDQPMVITEDACPDGSGSFSITFDATGAEIASGPMIETPKGSGHYEGSAPRFDQLGIHGYATIHVHIDCPDPQDNKDFDVTIYIDPSGNVVDTAGNPIAGATVTLLRSDSDAGPFEVVANGSAIMSPANRINPDTSDSVGHYGWDVIAGFYKVRAEKSGCGSTESPVLTIPPPVTDLNLVLDCGGNPPPTPVARGIEDACPPGQIPEDGFTDVPPSNVHEAAIDCMAFYGIATGRSASEYGPSLGVTRAQMASFLARLIAAAGITLEEGPNAFLDDDGPEFAVHHENINKLANVGIVTGRADGTYGPALTVNRAQMATFLVRTFEFISGSPLPVTADWFPDDEGAAFAAHEANINKAAEAGFTGGRADGTYNPGGDVQRDQMASFLARVADKIVEDGLAQ